eukprot:TRINITY_DN8193_c2_g1_i4.p1 TRINITY_DN8193_c2_g1~~TRINITY_DN8193_c2_g1_i4.p1  ORF type:complete len:444 (+),score=47.43 TRINITY_DN8193_c2_g1_i4:479-1810(+)
MVHQYKNIHNNEKAFQTRLDWVFSKLNIYNLTEYDKVVYLDTDILVLENVDELFFCPGYCAALRNAFFNTGVIVLKPSVDLFEDLLDKRLSLPSYNAGEQGLMNSYFHDFDLRCEGFNGDEETLMRLDGGKCGRLPAYYNGDLGPYYLANAKWNLPEKRTQPKILHFTLGTYKPWQWWSYAPFDIMWVWYEVYTEIPRHTIDTENDFLVILEFFYPIIIITLIVLIGLFTTIFTKVNSFISLNCAKFAHWSESDTDSFERLSRFSFMSIVFGFFVIYLSANISFNISSKLPVLHPFFGWVLFIEWYFLISTILLLECFFHCYLIGRQLGKKYTTPFNKSYSHFLSNNPNSEEFNRNSNLRKTSIVKKSLIFFAIWYSILLFLIYCLNQDFSNALSEKAFILISLIGVLVITYTAMMFYLPQKWVSEGRITSLEQFSFNKNTLS